jgi:predicted AAA+ superfamily ATPase
MIDRSSAHHLLEYLSIFPVVGLLGPRQSGKTTLALHLAAISEKPAIYLDLERTSDLEKLQEAELYLESQGEKLVIMDEIQRKPELFPLLRSLVDARRRAGEPPPYFLILGSASRTLLQQTSESLAGRIGYLEMLPLSLDEVGLQHQSVLWQRGGYPDSFLADSDRESTIWREEFIATFLERDLGQLGFNYPAVQLRRLWSMLAHNHSQLLNFSRLASGLGLRDKQVRTYIDTLTDLYMLRQLQPWSANNGKRLSKRPKVYIRDTGLLHTLANIPNMEALFGHPLVGPSWEGFVIETLIQRAGPKWEAFYYRASGGAEIDLVMVGPQGERIAIEIKRTLSPQKSRGFRSASEDIQATARYFIIPTQDAYPLDPHTQVVGLNYPIFEKAI